MSQKVAANLARVTKGGSGWQGQNILGTSLKQRVPPSSAPVPQQCCSPSTLLLKKNGCAMEKSILLCGLFLGMGLDAYVCVGNGMCSSF